MANLQDIISIVAGLKIEPYPVAIVVDTSMMMHICDIVPVPRGKLGSIDGVPVYIDDTIGLSRGYIRYSDGRIEKFGAWPKPEKTNAQTQ